ncbi:hypothetical protein RhiirA1_456891 [Rhizophagus irregularis]|uniref:Uncharacterized protein n=1 Tax=Rhizophagus irregularis TaxID=588596 RepID=A0A2I1F8I6_9GLOM|nr:hypothetical protein RhiirA1_456891 [Rhizophagus irregularis]PKY30692.1 hypothetical protein RhiirB3_447903 [Rhizophagus irregularis]
MLLNVPRQSSFVRKDAKFYRNQLTHVLTKQGRKEKQNIKKVHSNRLGMSYTVTINKYNRGMGQQNRDLRLEMESGPHQKKDNYATKERLPENTAYHPYLYNMAHFV